MSRNAMLTAPQRPDLHADMRAQILATLPFAEKDRQAIEGLDLSLLLIAFLNWRSRFIISVPRRVHLSKHLVIRRALIAPDENAALETIIAGIGQGRDLSPHLSRSVTNGIVVPEPGPKRLGRPSSPPVDPNRA